MESSDRPSSPKIPPAGPTDNRGRPRRPLSRAGLAASTLRVLRAGRGAKADLLLVDCGSGPLVVKDYAPRGPWARWLGRHQISRELAAYRRLESIDGFPKLIGRVDRFAMAIEWIDGELLATAPDRILRGKLYLERLGRVVEGMHRVGVVHLDLRSNKNVILASDGRLVVVDLAAALRFRPGSLAHRWLFPRFQLADLTGLLKWKQALLVGELTDAERTLMRRQSRWRRLWPINRKTRPDR